MRALPTAALTSLLALPALLASPASAQPCSGGGEIFPVPAEPGAADIAAPGLFLMLPTSGTTGVPLNVQLKVNGTLTSDMEAILETEAGERVSFTLDGDTLIPDAPLAPNTVYHFYSDFLANPCGADCFGFSNFTTGVEIDEAAPALPEAPSAHAFVNDVCDFGGGHSLAVSFASLPADVAWLEAAVLLPNTTPRKAFAGPVFGTDFFLGGDQTPLGLDEVVRMAFTPIDLAGNVGEAVIVRTPARSRDIFDEVGEISAVPEVQCTLDAASRVGLSGAAPAGGLVEVDFPFEATPVALSDGSRAVDLIPVEDTPRGQRLLPAEELGPGEWSLVAKPCAFCACAGCALRAEGSLTVAAAEDAAAPEAPRVLAVDEVVDPDFSEGVCAPDQTALLVRIAPGVDDGTAPADLRYHASVRVEDALPLQVGRFLAPEVDGDAHLLRLDTAVYGALLTENLTIELVAVDLSDNSSAVTAHVHEAVAGAGCSAHGVPATGAPAAGLALFGLALALRRRRR